ncbi:MAG: glycosyltransferase [Chloroflexi bacterium]|nr:glycosyltransferase [Chloroflexota bacterium]
MRRALLLVLNLPSPPRAGVGLRCWQNINGLLAGGALAGGALAGGALAVFGLRGQSANPPPLDGIAFWRGSQEPVPWGVDGRGTSNFEWLSNPVVHPADQFYSPRIVAELDEILQQFNPQVVILEELWLYPYIDYFKSQGRFVLLDAHNVEGPLHQAVAASPWVANSRSRWVLTRLAERVALVEGMAVSKVDQIWTCSEHDAQLMRDLYRPSAPVYVVPNTVDVASYEMVDFLPLSLNQTPQDQQTIIFPAMFGYPPNQAAAQYLLQEVFPRLLQRISGCRLILAGSHPTPAMIAAAQGDPRIVVTGAVADVRPFLAEASAMVAPLFEGGGTRFKILEAFAAGVPVITTAKGIEGLDALAGVHFLHAESPDDFVAALTWLWSDARHGEALREQARHLVLERYSQDVASRSIAAALAMLPISP